MLSPTTFPYLAKATIKYKSPHKQDLTFAKGETIRVTGVAPKTDNADEDDDDDDDDDWLIGETLDGSRSGTFPGGFVEPSDEVEEQPSHAAEATIAEATALPSAPGAIPSDAPTDLQRSAIEEPPAHQAEKVPAAAREAAQKGETEAGFGAPLPPRPPSPDADDDEDPESSKGTAQSVSASNKAEETPSASFEATSSSSKPVVETAAATAGAAGVATASSATESKSDTTPAAKSPPVVSSKPPGMSSSFRDRLAAFNKPAEPAPPPLPKGKPGGWKRPTPASNENKPLLPGAPAASTTAAPKPAAVASPSTETKELQASTESSSGGGGGGGAFSAADAQSSIKMSLKERMAALQRNEAAANEAAAPQLKPKPSVPGKIGADRRNVALQGMGFAPGAAVPPRKSSAEAGAETGDTAAAGSTTEPGIGDPEAAPVKADQAESDAAESGTNESGLAAEEEVQETKEDSGEPKEALTEEEQEAERRAAIAKRMAALGARRMGGAPTPFGAPAPPGRTKTSTSIESTEGTTSEPGISLPAESSGPAASEGAKEAAVTSPAAADDTEARSPVGQDAGEEPKILAVPRRTAAPRKKKPVPQAAAAAAAGAGVADVGTGVAAEESETAAPAVEPETEASGEAVPAEDVTSTSDDPVQAATSTEEVAEPTHVAVADEAEDAPQVSQQEVAGDDAVEDDSEIAENQRQLEEYLRGEGFYEDQIGVAPPHEDEVDGAVIAAGHVEHDAGAETVESAPREDVTSPKPPSRPASTRPPTPKTSLPAPPTAAEQDGASIGRISSPPAAINDPASSRRGSLIPPVPTTPLPVPKESAAEELGEPQSSSAQVEDEGEPATGPVLAAPRPRMAVATEDPEDEELLAAADSTSAVDAGAAAAVETNEEPSQEAAQAEPEQQQEQEQPEELTEEEQESQRRANLARRMAALGGQRIGAFPGMAPPPIMGAPMPVRKAPVQTEEAPEEQQTPQGESELAFVPRAKSPGAASVEAPVRLASPPPVPTSPPLKPMSPPPPARAVPTASDAVAPSSPVPPSLPPGRPSNTVPMANLDEAIRSASPANSSLGRRTSMKPPVPSGISASHSRDSSSIAGEHDGQEERELATSPPPLPVSPPPLPVSPPPRPSSRAPPLPGHGGVPPRRQGSSASYGSAGVGQHDLPPVPVAAATSPAGELPTSPVPTRTESSLPPPPPASAAPAAPAGSNVSIGARHSSRDLDLMPSSRWWRHGLNPLRLPPTVAGRPDAILYADTSSNPDPNTGVQVHKADINILFEDYSTTTVSLSFQDDDLEETHTRLEQKHSFPPTKPSQSDLKQWSTTIGAHVAKLASDAAKSGTVGDGSSRAFTSHILSQTQSLPPVGSSLGAVVLTQVGPTTMEQSDEPRSGDIVSCANADFKGKKGLAPYHVVYGSQNDPLLAVVVEVEAKKNKLKCVTQGSGKKGGVDEISLRMDDLKSGIVKVWRVAPRQGWVNDW